MARIPIALQLWSIRESCKADLPSTLATVAKMGYEGVEFAGFYDYSPTQLHQMLTDNGLQVAGAHTALPNLQGEAFVKTVEFNLALGNKYMVIPNLPADYWHSKAACQKTADMFSELAERLQPYGLMTGYHNHPGELMLLPDVEGTLASGLVTATDPTPASGLVTATDPTPASTPTIAPASVTAYDALISASSPHVVMQIDVGHAMRGGADPVVFIKRYPGRAKTIHLKEYDPTDETTVIGEGIMPWAQLFTACETVGGTEWYIVEHERYSLSPMECVDLCIKNLKRMGK